MIGWNDGLRV